ncbi:MAG: diguanylate cyclase [Selenomonadaceae bacterium]|nr:diguanylate cyclase [Selenomonadaceae bacterium]
MPAEIVNLTAFVPPVLGLMWGPIAAWGVYVGGLLALPDISSMFSADVGDRLMYFVRGLWVFLAAYLPYCLRRSKFFSSRRPKPALKVLTLKRFLIVMVFTFVVTSIFKALTAPTTELEELARLLDARRQAMFPLYVFVCFMNDFCVAIFVDLVWFFYLVGREYDFHYVYRESDAPADPDDDPVTGDEHKALIMSMRCYFLFPIVIAYLDVYQIYGMDNIATWMRFVIECLSIIDLYLVLMLYLLLRYRRSIMMEIVFMVALTVFLSAAVLGWGSSVAMTNLVKSHTDDSLRAMSVICRERLDRTFFCIRQAVNGMERQAIHTAESYERLRTDAAYRAEYLSSMEQRFDDIARGTDGCITYYLHLAPELGGTKSGFFMAREDARWEGALSKFIPREVTDLALFSPDDDQHVGWYYIPFKSKCATWIEPYIDPTTNSYVISYVAPIYIDQKFSGVIGIEIDFNFIIHELRRMSIYDYGYVYIMNRNNVVLYHKDQPQGSVFEPNPEFQEIELYLTNGMWLGIAIPLERINDERNRIMIHLIASIIVVAMMISVGSIAVASKAIRPLAGMTEAAKRIASGDLHVTISYESGNELGLLVRSIREMAAKLEGYVYRDKLTGVWNAAAYMSKRTELDAQNQLNPDIKYGVVILDANFLKKVNDKYGHEAGNELIRRAAKVICAVFRHSQVFRIGGDEFAAILENQDYEYREGLLKLFDVKTAEEHFTVGGDVLTVSVARGLGVHEHGMEFAKVSEYADVAMYNHKAALKAKYGEEVR